MTADILRRAAGDMRAANNDFWDALADLLDEIALRWHWTEERELATAVAVAHLNTNTPTKTPCPRCKDSGHRGHVYVGGPNGALVACPSCHGAGTINETTT